MDKKDLVNIINELFLPLGFKKKGNCWVLNGNEITKMVTLQKSNFGNQYYVNYGYIINSLPLYNEFMHVFFRLGSIDDVQNVIINELLDMDNYFPIEKRAKELKQIIWRYIISDFQIVNTEKELLNELMKREHLNSVSLAVKKHFQIQC